MKNKRKASLPGLPALRTGDAAVDAWAARVNEHLETRMGARGDELERTVTFRDLEELASKFVTVGGGQSRGTVSNKDGYAVDLGGGASAFIDFKGFLDALMASALWRDFFKKLTDPTRFDDLPEKVRAILLADLSEEAARRGADVRRLEEKLQSQLSSLAYSVTEVTASVAGSSAGVREAVYASATANRATAGKVTQIVAALAGTGAAAFEEQVLVIADRIEGLRSQYTIKLSAGGAMAGFGIAVEQNGANAPASSAFLIQADRFAIVSPSYSGGPTVTPDPSQVPFGVDATGVYINGNVRINANGTRLSDVVEPKGILINADSQFFKRDSADTMFTPTTITLTAVFTGNVTGTVTWFRGTTQVATNTMTYTVNPADFAGDTQAYSARVTSNGITYQDFITIVKLRDGADSLTALLTNESHTVSADANGNNVNYAGASGQMQVFRGSTRLTSGVTYSVAASTGFTPAPTINPDGTYNITAGLTADVGTVTFRADVGGVALDKVFTLTKARQGVGGATGTSTVIVYAYKRSATEPTDNPGAYTYTFATNAISPAAFANGWTRTIPAGTDPLYVVASTPSGSAPTDDVTAAEWSAPVLLVKDGAAGANGLQAATVFIYTRTTTSTAPTIAAGSTSTYDFASGALTGAPSGWTTAIPAESAGPYLWVAQATAAATAPATTDTIASSEFASSIRLLSTSVRDLTLVASSQTFKYDTSGALNPATQSITFTANSVNLSGAPSFTAVNNSGVSVTLNVTGNVATLTSTAFGSATSVEVTVTQGGLTDKVTVYRLQDGAAGQTGAGGIVGYLTNPYINVPADSTGGTTTASYANATGTFQVFQGTTDITSTFTFSFVSPLPSGFSGQFPASPAGSYKVNGTGADSQTVTIRASRTTPTALQIDRQLVINKVKQGQQGNTGQTGPSGARGNITVYVSNASNTYSAVNLPTAAEATQAIANEASARTATPTTPIKGDEVYFRNANNNFAYLLICTVGGASPTWAPPGVLINGDLLVTGTVAGSKLIAGSVNADRLNTSGLEIKDAAGNVVLRSGNVPINALPSFNSIRRWNFDATLPVTSAGVTTYDGWTSSSATITPLASSLRIVCGADQQFISPLPLYVEGARYDRVQVRLRRLGGAANTTWDGRLYYRGPSGIYITAPLTAPVNNDPNATIITVGGTQYKVGLGVSAGSTFIPLQTLAGGSGISASITPGQSVLGTGVPAGTTVRSVTNGVPSTSEQAVKQISDPTEFAAGAWVVAEWDMSTQLAASSSAGAWVNQFIADIRLDFGVTGGDYEIDWIAIGRNVAGGPDRITPENVSTFIDALSVNTLQIANEAVVIPRTVESSGTFAATGTVLTYTFSMPQGGKVIVLWGGQMANANNYFVRAYLNQDPSLGGAVDIGNTRTGGTQDDEPVLIAFGTAVAGTNTVYIRWERNSGGTLSYQRLIVMGAQR